MDSVRIRIPAVVAAIATGASLAVVALALASSSANGLPSYMNGYAKWPRINRKPFTKCGPPCAHSGLKNVYTSKKKVGPTYPNGTCLLYTSPSPRDS